MIKKIKVEQLKPGMFVHNINCSWLDHPFLKSNVMLNSDKMIRKIIDIGIREVHIDTHRGLDIDEVQAVEELQQDISSELMEVAEGEREVFNRISLQEELEQAKEIKREAKQLIKNIMEDLRYGKQLELERADNLIEKMINSIFRNSDALLGISRIKKVDEYTFMHSVSVCALMISYCRQLSFDPEVIRKVGIGALLHDIGKVRTPLDILNKNTPLSAGESEIIKKHVEHGCNILSQTSGITQTSMLVVAEHHERYDGTGYPKGLKGEEISIFGQMAGIADVYDALTSDRPYRKRLEPSEALKRILNWDKFNFNEEMVHQFIRCVGIYPIGSLVRLESGLLGVVIEQGTKDLLHPVVQVVYDPKRRGLIEPYIINLSELKVKHEDSIICHESPEKWDINPHGFLED